MTCRLKANARRASEDCQQRAWGPYTLCAGAPVLLFADQALSEEGTKKPTAPPPIKRSAPDLVTIFEEDTTSFSYSVLCVAWQAPMLIVSRRPAEVANPSWKPPSKAAGPSRFRLVPIISP
jgi:hypothetical protein